MCCYDDDEVEVCYYCRERGNEGEIVNGACTTCGLSVDAPAMKWARAVADDDPDGFQR